MHYAMVKSINEVGQVMSIADFTAPKDIIDCLREVGVDNAQGYAVARPAVLASVSIDDERPALTAVKPGQSAS